MAAEVKAIGSSFEIGAVKTLFETRSTLSGYDVTADGQRFIVANESQPNAAITLVVNWDVEVKK